MKASTIDTYIAQLPEHVRDLAEEVRNAIHDAAPGATEAIQYQIPAFRLGASTFLYFGVWKTHIGLYPVYRGDDVFEEAVADFRAKKDSVHLPLAQPIPIDLIAKIVRSQIGKLSV